MPRYDCRADNLRAARQRMEDAYLHWMRHVITKGRKDAAAEAGAWTAYLKADRAYRVLLTLA